jgi:hypothetical protein
MELVVNEVGFGYFGFFLPVISPPVVHICHRELLQRHSCGQRTLTSYRFFQCDHVWCRTQ